MKRGSTKADLINKISGQTGIEKPEAKLIFETFYEVVIDSMSKKNDVFLRGFGTFYVLLKKEKEARDIRRNKSVIVPTHYRSVPPFFSAALCAFSAPSAVKLFPSSFVNRCSLFDVQPFPLFNYSIIQKFYKHPYLRSFFFSCAFA
jgi:DNA-binding protein HU-beta